MQATIFWAGMGLMTLAIGAIAQPTEQEKMRTDADKKRVLIVTHTAGFRHTDSIEAGEKILAELAQQSGRFTVDYCRTADDVKKMLTPQYLNENRIDGVIFLNTTGDIGIPDLNAFLD